MSDPISWGLLASIKKLVKSVKTSVDNIDLSPVTGAVEDIATDLGQDMDELVANVGAEVDEMKEAVEDHAGGLSPTNLQTFSAESVDEGIKVTLEIKDDRESGHPEAARAKGVMVRYSEDGYPKWEKDGVLGFDIQDIYDAGTLMPKQVSQTITGLTNGKTYYLSAFPYSFYGVYNHGFAYNSATVGTGRTTCAYTGNKGTLTVDVTQDYDYKELGEFTATLTPSSGSAKTQTRTGPGQVVFAGLDAGTYTLSFSAETYFTTPASQEIVITAGQPNTTSAEYKFSASFSQCTWSEIKQIADDGRCKSYFSLGDKKSVSIQYISTPEDGYTTQPTLSKVTTNLVIVDFDAMDKENGGKANLQLCTEDVVTAFSSEYTVDNRNGYWLGAWCSPEESKTDIDYPYMRKYIEGKISNILPDEILNVVTPVKVSAKYWRRAGGTSSTPDGMTTGSVVSKLFPPPKEFSHWSTNTKRIKKDAKTKAVVTWQTCDGTNYVNVYDFQYKSYNSNGALSGDSNYSGGLNNVIRHPMCVCI